MEANSRKKRHATANLDRLRVVNELRRSSAASPHLSEADKRPRAVTKAAAITDSIGTRR